MKIESLTDLERVSDNYNLYNLSGATYRSFNGNYYYNEYIVPEHFEMRMDLICNDIYKSTDYVDFLLWFNDIINPFNIRKETVLYYVLPDLIPRFLAPKENETEVQQVFLNKSKVTRRDKNRDKYKQEVRAKLPPTMTDRKNEQVKVEGDSIIIGGDIFNV